MARAGTEANGGVLQAAVGPVAVGREHGREPVGRRGLQRAVEVAAEIVAGEGFEQHFLDGVVLVLDAPEDLGVEVVFRKQGQQAGGGENLLAQEFLAGLPLGECLVSPGGEVGVRVGEVDVARVLRGDLGLRGEAGGEDGEKKAHGYTVVQVGCRLARMCHALDGSHPLERS